MSSLLAFFVNDTKTPLSSSKIYGGERRFIRSCEHFAKLGITLYAIEICPSLGKLMHVPYHPYCISGGQKNTLLRLILNGTKLVRELRCDAIIAYNAYHMHTLIPAYLTSLFTRKPLIIWVVDILRKPQDELSLIRLFMNRVRSGSPVILALRFAFLHFMRRMAVKNAAACFVGSNATAHYVRKYMGAKNVYLTGYGIDELWSDHPDQPILFEGAYLGRIDPQKGLDVLLKAWQRVSLEKDNAKLVIIGSGDEKNEKHLREEISSLGLYRNVSLAGYLEGRELVTRLCSAKIFIFPSKSEDKPIAVAEAMAAGLPCVISDIPALREVYSQAAILVSPEEPQLLGEEILNLLHRPELMKELSIKGKMLVSDQTWGKVATLEHNIVRSVLKNPVQSSRL